MGAVSYLQTWFCVNIYVKLHFRYIGVFVGHYKCSVELEGFWPFLPLLEANHKRFWQSNYFRPLGPLTKCISFAIASQSVSLLAENEGFVTTFYFWSVSLYSLFNQNESHIIYLFDLKLFKDFFKILQYGHVFSEGEGVPFFEKCICKLLHMW